jgi:hypothetical protein
MSPIETAGSRLGAGPWACPSGARPTAVPPAARALSTLPRIDYADACVAELRGPQRSGEEWVRTILEEAPLAVRTALRAGWLSLGLRLDPGVPDRVLGWNLRRKAPDFALLTARSPLGIDAEVLLKCEGRMLYAATFLQLHNPLARAVWAPIAPGHRQVVRALLKRAAGREAGRE